MTNNLKESELNIVIAPEIKNDEFYQSIQEIARFSHIKTLLEIGSSSGKGSTEALTKGVRENSNQPTLFCIEVSKTRFNALKHHYRDDPFVRCYNNSSIAIDQFPDKEIIKEFYHSHQTFLNKYPLEIVLSWLSQDINYVKVFQMPDNGI
ncbi:MAG: hypothetical protein ACQJCO_08285 [cyanobacterium endosymbiont of Rhopalodia sterrenbergii]